MRAFVALTMAAALCTSATGAITSNTLHGPDPNSLDGSIVVGDMISGMIATELPGDQGWHGANTNPADQLPAFTDDAGILGSGLTGLLNDFPPVGQPTKLIQYDLPGPTNIEEIRVLTGNNGRDGRVFSTFTVYTSTDNGGSFGLLGYFESDLPGTINNGQWGSTLVSVFDDESPVLASDVTNIQFNFYAVDNTQNEYRDPFDGVNPFTGIDDGLTAAFVSPLVFEIDVIGTVIPEPGTVGLLACALTLAFAALRRRLRAPQ